MLLILQEQKTLNCRSPVEQERPQNEAGMAGTSHKTGKQSLIREAQ